MGYSEMSEAAALAKAGSEGLVFLPYLGGERTPHMNPFAKAVWHGLTLRHDRSHMVRSVMEGVAFSLWDSMEVLRELSIRQDRIIASGGGAQSRAWMQILADVFDRPIYRSAITEQACAGAAMAAGCGAGVYRDIGEACAATVRWHAEAVEPECQNTELYRELHGRYQAIYADNQHFMNG
jgi:xylulokinase